MQKECCIVRSSTCRHEGTIYIYIYIERPQSIIFLLVDLYNTPTRYIERNMCIEFPFYHVLVFQIGSNHISYHHIPLISMIVMTTNVMATTNVVGKTKNNTCALRCCFRWMLHWYMDGCSCYNEMSYYSCFAAAAQSMQCILVHHRRRRSSCFVVVLFAAAAALAATSMIAISTWRTTLSLSISSSHGRYFHCTMYCCCMRSHHHRPVA